LLGMSLAIAFVGIAVGIAALALFVGVAPAASRGPLLAAQLVLLGVLPQRFARRRLHTAIQLFHLRSKKSGERRLELEGCVTDAEVGALIAGIQRFGTSTAVGVLAFVNCTELSAGGLCKVLEAAFLPSAGRLNVLDLHGCIGLGDDAAEMLSTLLANKAKGLSELGMSSCGLSAVAVSAMNHAVNAFVPPVAAEDFSAMSLTSAGAGAAPKAPLAALPSAEFSLRALRLSFNGLAGAGRSLAGLVRGLPRLDVLSLEACGLLLEDLQQLARALPRSSVARLDLADNALKSKGLLAIASGLRASHVEDLGLEQNEIGFGEALMELKETHNRRPFATLRLSGNRLTASQEAAFLQALRTAPKSKRLRSSYCPPECKCFEGRGEVM